MSDELKPCDCGRIHEAKSLSYPRGILWGVYCPNCGDGGTDPLFTTKEKSIEFWNCRHAVLRVQHQDESASTGVKPAASPTKVGEQPAQAPGGNPSSSMATLKPEDSK